MLVGPTGGEELLGRDGAPGSLQAVPGEGDDQAPQYRAPAAVYGLATRHAEPCPILRHQRHRSPRGGDGLLEATPEKGGQDDVVHGEAPPGTSRGQQAPFRAPGRHLVLVPAGGGEIDERLGELKKRHRVGPVGGGHAGAAHSALGRGDGARASVDAGRQGFQPEGLLDPLSPPGRVDDPAELLGREGRTSGLDPGPIASGPQGEGWIFAPGHRRLCATKSRGGKDVVPGNEGGQPEPQHHLGVGPPRCPSEGASQPKRGVVDLTLGEVESAQRARRAERGRVALVAQRVPG